MCCCVVFARRSFIGRGEDGARSRRMICSMRICAGRPWRVQLDMATSNALPLHQVELSILIEKKGVFGSYLSSHESYRLANTTTSPQPILRDFSYDPPVLKGLLRHFPNSNFVLDWHPGFLPLIHRLKQIVNFAATLWQSVLLKCLANNKGPIK